MDQQHLRKILRVFGALQQGSEKERAPEAGQSARCLHQGISSGIGSVVTTSHCLPRLLNNLRGIFCCKGLSEVNFLSGLSKEQDHQPWGQDFHRRAPPSAWGSAGRGGTEGRSGRLREARGQIRGPDLSCELTAALAGISPLENGHERPAHGFPARSRAGEELTSSEAGTRR